MSSNTMPIDIKEMKRILRAEGARLEEKSRVIAINKKTVAKPPK